MLVGLVVVCVLLGLLRRATDPAPPQPASELARPDPARPASPVSTFTPASPPSAPALPTLPEAPELHGQDTVNPCTAGSEPIVPADYESMTAQGITVAWPPGGATSPKPYDVALSPTAIAYLVNGFLEEAAVFTGTPRRPQLTVVIHPSHRDLVTRTHAPSWAGGAYDGGAIHVAIQPGTDLGVATSTLRHELMHAQLHAAVGCMPTWFNEGMAMYFDGTPPIHQWMRMLRSRDDFDLSSLRAPVLTMMPGTRAERVYAESLAMIVFIVERTGEPGLRGAVQVLEAAARESRHRELDLWERLYPDASHRAVLDALAHKIFGVAPASELDDIFKAAVCCYGLRRVYELHCRGAPLGSERFWIDKTSSPEAACTTW